MRFFMFCRVSQIVTESFLVHRALAPIEVKSPESCGLTFYIAAKRPTEALAAI